MPPTMMTQSAGRPAATSRGWGIVTEFTPTIVAQVGDQSRGQGNGRNQMEMPEAVVRMSWEDFKTLTREEFYMSNKMKKLDTELRNHAMVRADHAAYADRFHELTRNGPIKKNPKKRGNRGKSSKDRNVRDDNNKTRIVNAFSTITNPVRRENMGTVPKCTTCSTYHPPGEPCRTCFNYNRPSHFAKDCRVPPKNVNPINTRNPVARACYKCASTDHIKSACPRLNQAQRPGLNHQNEVVAINGGQGRRNQRNQVRGRAFILGTEESHSDPNIVMGTIVQCLNDWHGN
nr:hypothetical protein [Tanacetum cinerariifolium]